MAITGNRLTVQAQWIGAGFGSMDDTSLFFGGLGSVIVKAGIAYQLVKFYSGTTTVVAGTPLGWQDEDDFVVSAAAADWLSRNAPAGVALGAQTASKYGWIQVEGPGPSTGILTAGQSTVAGQSLILASTDGVVARIAAGTASTYIPLAITTATSLFSGTALGVIVAPHNGW